MIINILFYTSIQFRCTHSSFISLLYPNYHIFYPFIPTIISLFFFSFSLYFLPPLLRASSPVSAPPSPAKPPDLPLWPSHRTSLSDHARGRSARSHGARGAAIGEAASRSDARPRSRARPAAPCLHPPRGDGIDTSLLPTHYVAPPTSLLPPAGERRDRRRGGSTGGSTGGAAKLGRGTTGARGRSDEWWPR